MRGDYDVAIDLYHQALSRKPDDPFSSELLSRALRDVLQFTTLFPDDHDNDEKKSTSFLDNSSSMAVPTPGGGGGNNTPSSAMQQQSSMMTDDGLSLSVDDSGDVDMSLT